MIESNPTLGEDHCSGIILATLPLTYEAFDNKVAAGKQLNIMTCPSGSLMCNLENFIDKNFHVDREREPP